MKGSDLRVLPAFLTNTQGGTVTWGTTRKWTIHTRKTWKNVRISTLPHVTPSPAPILLVHKNVVVPVALSLELVTDECRKKALPHRIECLTRCDKNSPTYIEIDDLAMLHRRLLRVRVLVCYVYN